MQLTITANSSLKSIQLAFSEVYPFLKIEFVKKGESLKAEKLGDEKLVKIFTPHLEPLQLSLDSHLPVSSLETNFHDLLGLYIKVFRRSGTVWVETQHTEHWTLEQQNEEGRLFSPPETWVT